MTEIEHQQAGSSGRQSGKRALKSFLIFLAIVAAALLYVVFSDSDVSWGGFVAMLGFYALFFWLGAVVAGRRVSGLTDTMVAGRSLPLWIGIFTMTATWVGGGYISGTAEATYASGLVWAQAPWGYALSLIIGGIFFAPVMRRHKFMTMLDPIDLRFGKRMAGASAVPAMLGEVFWSGAILTALGTMFGTILGIDFAASILLSAAIAVAYTVVGGMWSVAMTDVAQLVIVFLGLILVLPFAFAAVGGWDSAISAYESKLGEYFSVLPPLTGWNDPAWGHSWFQWWDFALLLIFGGIPWQVYFQRVLSAKNEFVARWLSVGAGFVAIAAAIPAMLLAIAATGVNWQQLGAPPLENPALVLPYVYRYAVPLLVGLLGLGALAGAVMSSVDSSILSASSLGGWNVYRRLLRPRAKPLEVQRVVRRLIVIVGVAAALLALNIQSVYDLWYLASDLIYVLVFPQLVCALFVPWANRIGSVAGFTVAVVLRLGGGSPVFGLPPLLPYPWIEDGTVLFPFRTLAMVTGLLTILVVSALTRRLDPPRPKSDLSLDSKRRQQLRVEEEAPAHGG